MVTELVSEVILLQKCDRTAEFNALQSLDMNTIDAGLEVLRNLETYSLFLHQLNLE